MNKMLIVAFALVLAGCAGSKLANRFASKEIQVDYDRFKDVTTLQTFPPIEIDTGFLTDLELTAFFKCSGQRILRPERLGLGFSSSSQNGFRYGQSSELIFIADGHRISLGTVLYSGSRDPVLTTIVNEVMAVEISVADFERLAKASTVEARLGSTEFRLTIDQRILFKMLCDKYLSTR